jgi:hypothetical protein
MYKFPRVNIGEELGQLPISRVTDEQVWQHLVSPVTKALLGPLEGTPQIRVMDTVSGLFPGDEVSNLNEHRLHGGQTGFVRFPYLHCLHKTENGYFIVKRDGMKLEAFCWFGDVFTGRGELILKVGLKDRRYDGTKRANDSALLDYKYDEPEFHLPTHPHLKALELSIYTFTVGSRNADVTGEPEFEKFFANPFAFMDRPQLFLEYFRRAWKTKRSPGQIAAPVFDVSRMIFRGATNIAAAYGYDIVDMACSHFHVVKWAVSAGFIVDSAKHAAELEALKDGLAKFRAAGQQLSRSQQSWACVMQNLAVEHRIPTLDMGNARWPQNNVDNECLWVRKPVSAAARKALRAKAA